MTPILMMERGNQTEVRHSSHMNQARRVRRTSPSSHPHWIFVARPKSYVRLNMRRATNAIRRNTQISAGRLKHAFACASAERDSSTAIIAASSSIRGPLISEILGIFFEARGCTARSLFVDDPLCPEIFRRASEPLYVMADKEKISMIRNRQRKTTTRFSRTLFQIFTLNSCIMVC